MGLNAALLSTQHYRVKPRKCDSRLSAVNCHQAGCHVKYLQYDIQIKAALHLLQVGAIITEIRLKVRLNRITHAHL